MEHTTGPAGEEGGEEPTGGQTYIEDTTEWNIQGGTSIVCKIFGHTRKTKSQMEKHMKNHNEDDPL